MRSWPDLIAGASHGQAAKLEIRRDLFTHPALESSGGGTWQGYTCGRRTLTELTPSGPVERLDIAGLFSDAGVESRQGRPDYEATIEAGERDRALVISYRWDEQRTGRVMLQRVGDRYFPVGPSRLPKGC